MKKITQLLLLAVAFVLSANVMAQSTVTGTIMDSELNAPLPGANIVEKGTSNGVSSDFDGNFTLKTDASSGEVIISYVGYASVTIAFNGNTNLGTITLSPDNSLEEIVVTGTGIIDLAEDRATPVAVSTIRASEIQNKIGTQDITMTLVNTPSIYVSGASGGFGDTRISVRGFEQDNTAYLINGQPINSMEDGKMFWSNWSGMSDIANAVQIQRGLGSSKLAISSVGGTVNFVTKSTDKRQGGFIYSGIANDNYIKNTVAYSTGQMENGWGASVMLSRWQGDGYNEGNFGAGETYFISIGYKPNENHNFNFLITGAPQYHDQNFSKSISTYLDKGRKYNNNWGTYQGKYFTERRNFYHKPVANLNWDFKINETTNLSTVVYASWGRGGGTGGRGRRERTADGYVDYDAIYAKNALITDGIGINFGNDTYITRASMNLHSWYGLVTNLEKQLSDNLTLNVGADVRIYKGTHFRQVENLHGLKAWRENIRLKDPANNHQNLGSFGTYKRVIATDSFDANPWTATFNTIDEDQRIAWDYTEKINYGGIFAQLEYANEVVSLFFQGSLSSQNHQRWDRYQYADQSLIDGTSNQSSGTPLPAGTQDGVKSEKIDNTGFNVKGGGSYTINENNKIYVNAGYYSRQPYHDNIYLNFTNQVNPLTKNEKIVGLEAGYSYASPNFSANVNLYRTDWKDRVTTRSFTDSNGDLFFRTNEGVEQLHSGIEIDFKAKATKSLRFNGFVSIGDWQYVGNSRTTVRDDSQNTISVDDVDVDGGKVGDAAQFTAGIGVDLKLAERLSIDADWRTYDNLNADVGAVKKNLELPSYDIVDMGVSYKMLLGKDKDKSLNIRANVNNLFYEVYLSDLRTNIEATSGDTTYNGINVANQGYFGLGRTWNLSLRFKF
jgi:CarboxypepD_reg-like domain/TonB dependent receptor-like, beta-barrel/TonB-dependent Receptor Plug Domain